jgi:hypothetical protein
MNDTQSLTDLIESLEIRAPVTAGSLALIPLLRRATTTRAELPSYLLYQQVHDMGLISIEEINEAGAVGELRVTNRANTPVLLVEGEVLLGMKQTRVLNLTILVPAQTNLTVPVSCVEAGRWRATSAEAVGKSDVHLAPSVRAAKTVTVARSMRSAGTFASDQGAVWAGVDVFEAPHVLAALWEGLVASYQAEAMVADGKPAKPEGARRWFRSIAAGSASVGPQIGLGAHVTVVAPNVEAAALVHEDKVLHLSAFPAHQTATAPRFAPPARRRS